jgi:hypothetical protein
MKNLRSTNDLTGYWLHAVDGPIGKVREVYFDDADWRVRHLVVDARGALRSRRVLVSPGAVTAIEPERRVIHVALTRAEVRGRPASDTDQPVAVQHRTEKRARHPWALELGAEALASVPEALEPPAFAPLNADGTPFDPHLRTTKVVTRLSLRATDGVVGRIDDLIVDEASWTVRYLVVELDGGRRVVLPPPGVRQILVDEKVVTTDLPRGVVAAGPVLDPAVKFTQQYERAVRGYYEQDVQAASRQ